MTSKMQSQKSQTQAVWFQSLKRRNSLSAHKGLAKIVQRGRVRFEGWVGIRETRGPRKNDRDGEITSARRKRACKGPECRASTVTARKKSISLVGAQDVAWDCR